MKAAGLILFAVSSTLMVAQALPTPYPDVRDTPPTRPPAATADELAKIKQDLSAARDRQLQPIHPPQRRTPAPRNPH